MVLVEVTYFIGGRLGPEAESKFLRALAQLDIEGPSNSDLERMSALVSRYADFPLGGTDASTVALAERLDTPVLISFDHRHLGAIRPKHCPAFELLP